MVWCWLLSSDMLGKSTKSSVVVGLIFRQIMDGGGLNLVLKNPKFRGPKFYTYFGSHPSNG